MATSSSSPSSSQYRSFGSSTSIPQRLTPKERGVYNTIIQNVLQTRLQKEKLLASTLFSGSSIPQNIRAALPTWARAVISKTGNAPHKPFTPRLLGITDVGKDYDDMLAILFLKELHRLGIVLLRGYVANLMDAKSRAQNGRSALDAVGLRDVEIAYGSDGLSEDKKKAFPVHPFEHDLSLASSTYGPLERGEDFMKRVLEDARSKGEMVNLLCISSLQDACEFSAKYPALFKETIREVFIQGNYRISSTGILEADPNVGNHTHHLPAAHAFHDFLQAYQIKSTVCTKAAAYGVPLTTNLLKEMGDTGHLLGRYLEKVQAAQDVNFYMLACEKKTGFEYIDQEWFLRNRSTWYRVPHKARERKPVGVEILPWCVLGAYDAVTAYLCAGDDFRRVVGAVSELTVNSQSSRHKVVGFEPFKGDNRKRDSMLTENGERMALVLSALCKGALMDVQERGISVS